MAKIMYPGNTQIVSVTLTDASKVLLTGATVTCNLVDGTRTNVPNCTNLAMTEVGPSAPGVYTVTVAAAFSPPIANNYILEITAVKSGSTLYGEAATAVQIRVIP